MKITAQVRILRSRRYDSSRYQNRPELSLGRDQGLEKHQVLQVSEEGSRNAVIASSGR